MFSLRNKKKYRYFLVEKSALSRAMDSPAFVLISKITALIISLPEPFFSTSGVSGYFSIVQGQLPPGGHTDFLAPVLILIESR